MLLKDRIRVYVTTQGSDGYGDRPATRAKRLSDAINTQPEAVETLRQHRASGSLGIVTVKAQRREIKALEVAREMCSAYRVDHGQQEAARTGPEQEDQPRESRKLEDYKVILGAVQFGRMCEEVNTRAPMLHELLRARSWTHVLYMTISIIEKVANISSFQTTHKCAHDIGHGKRPERSDLSVKTRKQLRNKVEQLCFKQGYLVNNDDANFTKPRLRLLGS
ncbi:hypothetical protein OIDMADRAFT_46684 [Oidiodendron maius Zn]|uniref:Uncharacterized protein n=1 Tax=Oidiodendron maius (strain Zn) TaxID=913774 RepID=A0A0C3DXC3_OIDMZ|nr:hypothetical protein OIDMADRAFT_46684 [Oidiodendron maius Zn]